MGSSVRPSLLAVLILVAVTWGVAGALQERTLSKKLLQARDLVLQSAVTAANAEERSNLAILAASEATALDSLRLVARGALAEAARNSRRRADLSRDALTPLPDELPPECAAILGRAVGLQDALIDAEIAYSDLDELYKVDSTRATSLRATVGQLQSELVRAARDFGAISDSLARARDIMPTSLKANRTRLAAVGRVIAIAGRPIEARGGLRSGLFEIGGLIDSRGETGYYAGISLDLKIF